MCASFAETALNELLSRVALVDRAGRLVYTNESWEELCVDETCPLTSVPREEPYLEALSTADDADLRDVARAARELLSGDETGSVLEYYVPAERPPVRIRLSRVDHDGAPHVMVVLEGSTGAVDADLKERAMDESPIGITISEPTTEDGDNPLVYVNDAYERITGYSREEALGRDCRFLQGEGTSEEAVTRMARAIDECEPVTAVVRNYRKDGEPFWNEVTIAPLYEGGEVTNFVGFQQDVTEREETKRELATERDRLAFLNQVVRHDIKNNMSIVLGWAEILDDHVDPEGTETFERILDAATHTRDLTESVSDVMDVLGTSEPALEPVSLTDILRTEIERVRSNFDYRLESLTVRGDGTLPDDLEVEATPLLSSVFTNLLNNAVLHNDADEIEIDVSVDVRADTVAVRIADNGPGIPDSRKADIFGRGEQALDSPGTGLGLYLVDTLVDTYGGDVWVTDNDPRGSVFTVELRRADDPTGT